MSIIWGDMMNLSKMRADMFNKKAQIDADTVLQSLNISNGDVIADLGAGGGYFTLLFAELTPKGLVYAVDVNASFLAYIQEQQKKSIKNIQTVLADNDDAHIPEKSCDLIFLRNVFHHIPDPARYLSRLKASLKPGGRVTIIEWKPGASHHGHSATQNQITDIMVNAGLKHCQSFDFLPKQTFNIYCL